MIQQDVPLKNYSSFRIGGNALYFFEAKSEEDLINGLREWKELSLQFSEQEKKIFVLGAGSNLLISDAGFSGLVIHNNIKFLKIDGNIISVGAGILTCDLIDFCIENSASGLEWAGGLPGSVGGAVRGNAGAFGGEIKDNIFSVESLDIEIFEVRKKTKNECDFDYRSSVFKDGEGKDEIIISASFDLKKGDKREIEDKVKEKINYRKTKHPLYLPSAGSIFKNVPIENISEVVKKQFEGHIKSDPFPVIPAACFLSEAGLKGKRIGDALVSPDRPNFILNAGSASSEDVKDLIELEKKDVKEKFGIALEVEVTIVE